MIVHPNDIDSTNSLLKSDIEIIPLEINDGWCRDSGAIFLLDKNNNLVLVSFWEEIRKNGRHQQLL